MIVAITEEGVPMKVHRSASSAFPTRVRRSACLAIAALAIAAPAAGASPIADQGTEPSPPPTRTQVVVRSAHDGFDWGSAGVGAAAGAGLMIVGVGAIGAGYRNRIRLAR
jgi:hypothetical protein